MFSQTLELFWLYFSLFLHLFGVIALVQHFVALLVCLHPHLLTLAGLVGHEIKFKYSYIIYANFIFFPFFFGLFYTFCSISHQITQQCIWVAFISFFGFFALLVGCFNLTIFCYLFMWGFYLFGPLSTINIGIFACT